MTKAILLSGLSGEKNTLNTDELRQRFLSFFESHGHKIYPSSGLVPKEDPTLLFTSAGMNQFKQEFLRQPAQFRRRATCQKCLRTDDLDKVGQTSSHHTFFEMLGNFSFGDYFKEEAISLAWEFLTKELSLPQEKLWVSVYQEDQQALEIWKSKGLAPEKITKLGAKENFWPANAPQDGPNGPCGPCSEIFYDQGKDFGCGRLGCRPGCGCERFVETWNLVFTQFDRQGEDNLNALPKKNIDTGMGLERMAAVLQGVSNNFEIDIFRPITDEVLHIARRSRDKVNLPEYRARNAITDHIRAVTFAMAEGVLPSNDERGYVIRKLIRRAVWHGRSLGIEQPYLYKIVPSVARVMKTAYPELEEKRENIAQVVLAEERRFYKTLERAVAFAEEMLTKLAAEGKTKIAGSLAFRLYDTYGLPLELLETIVGLHGFELDRAGFNQELEVQRRLSRQAASFATRVFVESLASKFKLQASKFVGEKVHLTKARVLALFSQDDQPLKEAPAQTEAEKDRTIIKIVLSATPFYGESGGQIGDTGVIKNKNTAIEIIDTKKIEQLIVHLGRVRRGIIKLKDKVEAEIDLGRRKDIARNHTATHLLQAGLRKVLGGHIRQAGSWVGADRLRFDFTHFQALTEQQLQRVAEMVNQGVRQNKKVQILRMSFEQAQKMGALAFFGDKYQETVRVMKISQTSLELCGGTHVSATGEIGLFKIISESAVASGIRRIEALTGSRAAEALQRQEAQVKELAETFAVAQEQLPSHIEGQLLRLKGLNSRLDNARLKDFKSRLGQMIAEARKNKGIKIIAREIASAKMPLLRLMADLLRQQAGPCVVVLASVWEERVLLICALTSDLRSRGLDAVQIIRTIARDVDGSGGGRADFAQAGGHKVQGLKQALLKVEEIVEKELKS